MKYKNKSKEWIELEKVLIENKQLRQKVTQLENEIRTLKSFSFIKGNRWTQKKGLK